jgi:predicted choloylglycine hydrolase
MVQVMPAPFLIKKNMKIREKMFESLVKKYESEISEAEATLMVYMENPVGIGEHPQLLEEMDKFVEKLANATDKLGTLKDFYKYNYGN